MSTARPHQSDGATWPRGYWRTWEPIIGATYATSLTVLRAWSNVVTTILYAIAVVILAYFVLIAKTGSLLPALVALLVPWAVVVGIIEFRRHRLAETMVRNLSAHGMLVAEQPTFTEARFLRWKRDHGVTTADLQESAPRAS